MCHQARELLRYGALLCEEEGVLERDVRCVCGGERAGDCVCMWGRGGGG